MGCHFLLQEIFPTQGLNSSLPYCRQKLYCLSHQEVMSWKAIKKVLGPSMLIKVVHSVWMDTLCDSVELAPLALGNYIQKIFLRPFLHVCGVSLGSLRIQESRVLFQPPLNLSLSLEGKKGRKETHLFHRDAKDGIWHPACHLMSSQFAVVAV